MQGRWPLNYTSQKTVLHARPCQASERLLPRRPLGNAVHPCAAQRLPGVVVRVRSAQAHVSRRPPGALLWRPRSCVRWVSSAARPAVRRFISPSAPGLCAAPVTPSAGRQSSRPGRPARARTTSVTGRWGERWGESTARGAGRLRSPPDPDPGRGPAPRGCARVLSTGSWTRPAPARGGRRRRAPWRPRSPGRQVRLARQAVGLWICTERAGWVPGSAPDLGLLFFTGDDGDGNGGAFPP